MVKKAVKRIWRILLVLLLLLAVYLVVTDILLYDVESDHRTGASSSVKIRMQRCLHLFL